MNKIKFSALVLGAVLLTTIGTTSAMAKCGESMMAKPMKKLSNDSVLKAEIKKVNNMKCGAAKQDVFLNIAQIKKQMIKTQIIVADSMKCGASKKAAIKHAKRSQKGMIQASNMKCGASKKAAIMAIKVN